LPNPGGTASVVAAVGARFSNTCAPDKNHQLGGQLEEFTGNPSPVTTLAHGANALPTLTTKEFKPKLLRSRRRNPLVWFTGEFKVQGACFVDAHRIRVANRRKHFRHESE
jgi:hypothetical protein